MTAEGTGLGAALTVPAHVTRGGVVVLHGVADQVLNDRVPKVTGHVAVIQEVGDVRVGTAFRVPVGGGKQGGHDGYGVV